MPSSAPQGRPGHRRSYTTTTFSTEHGPGAFVPLGGLPRRRPQKKFVLNDDEDDSPDDSHDQNGDDSLNNIPPKLQLKKDNSFRLSIATATDDDAPPLRTKQPSPTKGIAGVPFPRSSPSSVSAPASAPPTEPSPLPLRPSVTRTTSTPILLSNGKPLKSSLKSSSSSPHIPFPPQQPSNHLRARSAPSTPSLEHPVAKNVHFPTNEEGGLATVRIFNRSAKPASLSRPNGEDTETETEGELSTGSNSGFIRGQSAVFPLPRSPLSPPHHHHQHERSSVRCVIDTRESSAIPLKDPSPYGNVYLESLSYTPHSRSAAPQGLSGTLLVRNIAYEKQVVVRFTLDDWQTTSEVSSRHLASLSSLPTTFLSSQPLTHGDVAALHSSSSFSSSSSTSEGKAPEWDRFGFTIKLEDYAANLSKRTMFLVARYTAVGGGGPVESWDNNLGRNYKIAFRETAAQALQRGRTFAVSSPSSFSPSTLMTTSKPATPTSSSSSSSSASSCPLPAYSPPLSSSSSPPSSTTQPQHTQMVAQTTLLRLKRLNLRNYAAPSNSTPLTTPIPPTSSSGTGPASVRGGGGSSEVMPGAKEVMSSQGTVRENGSTGMEILGGFPAHVVGVPPLTKRDESESSEDEDEIKTPTVFEAGSRSRTPSPPIGREEFKFPPKAPSSSSTTTTTMPHLTFSSSSSPSPSTSPSSSSDVSTPTLNSNKLMPLPIPMDVHRPAVLSPLEMGTSPPFSMMAEIGSTFAKRRDAQHHHHSLSHPPTSSPSPTASSIKSQLNPSGGGDGVHWLWGHSIPDSASVPQTEEEVKKVLAGIREKSTSSPVRRVSPSSSGRTSPVKASASPLTKLPMDGGGAVVGRASSPVKKLDEEEEEEEGVEVVSPQPTKKSPDWSKVGSGWNKGVGSGMNGANHQSPSPISSNTPTSSPSPPLSYSPTPTTTAAVTTPTSTPTPNATPTPSSSSTTNDSVYQAFVRQWCFAQGPSPVLGTGTTTTTTPSHASLSSTTQGSRYAHGRERRSAEGAEGSELVV